MAKTEVIKNDLPTCSNPGNHYKRDVCYKFDVKYNCMVPYFGDKYDLYEKIQLAKTQVDLDMIIKRAKAGDMSVLNVKQANYGDVSSIPDNMNDLNELYRSIDSNFDKLPGDIKNLFGNDVVNFSQAVADGSFQEKLNNYIKSLNAKTETKTEVKVGEK